MTSSSTSASARIMSVPAVLAGAVGLGAFGAFGPAAAAAEPTTEQLMQQIEQLQNKVQQLEAKQQQALSARDVDATVESVLRDAERRSKLLQMEGFTAGYNKGKFVIQDAAGNWVLNPYLQFQFRNVTNYREDGGGAGDDDIQHGFEVRRMKFGFKGNAVTPDLTYNFRWEADQDGGGVTLEDAWVQYMLNDSMAVKAGQWKDNVFHEETMSSGKQLAVDRSLVNELLGGGATDYVQGVSFLYLPEDMPFRAEVALHDGLNTDNTNFLEKTGGALGIAPNFGVSARVEYKVMGDWKAYDDFSAMGNTEQLLVIGGGVNYSQDGSEYALLHTVDAQFEMDNGLGVYAAFLGVSRDLGGALDSLYDWGALVQAGYMLNDQWEVFARYDYTSLDDDTVAPGDEDSFNEFTLGANWYVGGGHNCKLTADVTFLPDGAPSDVEGIGVLAGDENQIILRAQFQLLL
ncbi:porin [Fontivita pretiosa]|uniref:porin n=1 Tax=Fontivita pretiosa TaxID=2989684 RepID=UPI003D1866E5